MHTAGNMQSIGQQPNDMIPMPMHQLSRQLVSRSADVVICSVELASRPNFGEWASSQQLSWSEQMQAF